MPEISVTLTNKTGLHARPAGAFVKTAKQFQSDVKALHNGKEANAKSILSVLALGAEQGSTLSLKAEGADAQQALDALSELIHGKFGETE
jgi:phosphocarrier protein HPr